MEATSSDSRIPVTVVTGYLGAGKTTLVNHLLKESSGKRFAVIVNEFGDIGIDGSLIESGGEELIELSSGCICCVVRGDLIRTIRALLARKSTLDGIIIETTGLANPSPVIQTMVIDQVISSQCRLDSVLCLVDCAHIGDQIGHSPDAVQQIAFSDHIVLNKIDVTSSSLEQIERKIHSINPFARISRTTRSQIAVGDIVGCCSFELERVEDQLPPLVENGHHHHDNHIHAGGISSLSFTSDTLLDADRLERWIEQLLARQGNDILRIKGVLSVVGSDKKLVLQAVNMMLEGDYVDNTLKGKCISRLVFIGRNLDREALAKGFESCCLEAA